MARRGGRPRRETKMIDGEAHMRCFDCGEWKALEANYYRQGKHKDGSAHYKPYCKPCDAARSAAAHRRWARRGGKNITGPFSACRLCKYPTLKVELVEGLCESCREVTARNAGRWIGSGNFSHAELGHEDRMAIYTQRAARKEPLFDEARAAIAG